MLVVVLALSVLFINIYLWSVYLKEGIEFPNYYPLAAFTKLFSQNPLTPAGAGAGRPRQNKYVNVLGRTINLAKIKKGLFASDDVSLVPGSWVLVRIDAGGKTDVLASKVSSYDIGDDGDIHYTTGYKVNRVRGRRHTLKFKHNVIENISVSKLAF